MQNHSKIAHFAQYVNFIYESLDKIWSVVYLEIAQTAHRDRVERELQQGGKGVNNAV